MYFFFSFPFIIKKIKMTFPPYLFNHIVLMMENNSWEHISTLAKEWYRRMGWLEPSEELLDLIVTVVRVKHTQEVLSDQ